MTWITRSLCFLCFVFITAVLALLTWAYLIFAPRTPVPVAIVFGILLADAWAIELLCFGNIFAR